MAPKSCQKTEEEQVPLTPADEKPVSSDLQPSSGTPTDTVAPSSPQGTKPNSTLTPGDYSVNQHLAPETLDPGTLRLLWDQRELEIKALRWAAQNGQNARYDRILQEVAGIPPVRSSSCQNKSLQNQVQKLTLELKAQKEQAELEKEHLEEQLKQNLSLIEHLETELQTFQKSCLLQLAQSSWVGRMLRSQTGSVEVVTTEILRDFSDLSENDESPITGESFRLEDVDWNSIAHRYPNLFTDFNSDYKQSRHHPTPSLDTWNMDSPSKHVEKPGKSLEWSSLPFVGSSSSGGADSESSSYQLAQSSEVKKVKRHLPTSEQMPASTRNLSGQAEDLQKSHSHQLSKILSNTYEDPDNQYARSQMNPAGSCVKIVSVSHREKFVRILNLSQVETIDLGGFVLQQLVRDFPVCMYRFPPATLLRPGHHITVWGEGTGKTKQQPPVSSGQDSFQFQSSRGCVTLLVNNHGQVISEHQDPPCVTESLRIFEDNTDWSIDRFPLTEARPKADPDARRRKCRVREPRTKHRRAGWAPRAPRAAPAKPVSYVPKSCLHQDQNPAQNFTPPRPQLTRTPRKPCHLPGPGPSQKHLPMGGLRPSGPPRPTGTGTRDVLPLLSTGKFLHRGEVSVLPETTKTETSSEILPALQGAAAVCMEDSPARQERKVRVCRKTVDRNCPLVALSVQSTAASKYGFRFLCYPPITEEVGRRL